MLPDEGEVLHFSEDPTITSFSPRVAATAQQPEAYVWAVDALNSPSYWFPRQCPRVCSWVGDGADRVHAVEEAWLATTAATTLWAYRFPVAAFEPFGERPHAWVSTRPVTPLGPPVEIVDLVQLHASSGVELRVLPTLEEHVAGVRAAGREFSAIRMGNAGVGPGGPFATRR